MMDDNPLFLFVLGYALLGLIEPEVAKRYGLQPVAFAGATA